MRTLIRFAEGLAFAAAILTVYPQTGLAQNLFLSPATIAYTITGPGTTATNNFTVFASTGAAVTSIIVTPINTTSGGNWLSLGGVSGNQFTLNVVNTTNLIPNTVYQGSVGVIGTTANGNITTTFPVSLTVGNAPGQPGTSNGLIANPSTIIFSENAPGQASPSSQTISVTLNGIQVPITLATFTGNPVTTPMFVNTAYNNGNVTLTVNSSISTPGTYQATETVFTNSGSAQIPLTLCFGSCVSTGPSGNGLTATPNPVSFTAQTGGNAAPQSVAINFNGSPTSVSTVTATTNFGGNWLLPSVGVAGIVSVGVNATGLSAGTYVGNVIVTTPEGQITFQVNLTLTGTPTLTAVPSTVNFAYQLGTNNPTSQTVAITSSGTPVSYTVSSTTASGGAQWLIVSPSGQGATPGTLTVSVQPSGLPAGVSYTGNIQITPVGATNGTINIPVTLLVSTNPILSTAPAALAFTAQVGGTAGAQTLQILSSSTALSYTLTSSVTSPAGGSWLQVPTQSGTTPGTVSVSVNTQGLAAGSYSGTIGVSSPNAGNGTLQVPVTLTITAGSALQVSPAALTFAYEIGQAQPPNQSVTLTSTSGPLGFTVSATTNNGQPWLTVNPTSGTAPGNFIATVNAAGLLAGSYQGSISVTTNGSNAAPQMIPVTLIVSATALLVPSPGSILFTVPQGSTTNSFQTVAITSTDSTVITFNVSSTTNSVSNWLLVSASTLATPSNLQISANPNGLSPGTYTGTVTLTATNPANVANSPQNISVTLIIAPTATLQISQSSLSFTQASGGPAPNPQTLSVTSVGGAITFASTVTLNAGVNWLTVSPTNATTPASLTVTANGANLGPGTYTGQITLSSPGAAGTQAVSVNLVVSNAPAIVTTPATLSTVNFQIGSSAPAPLTIQVSTSNGIATAFTAGVNIPSGGAWLAVSPTSGTTPSNIILTVNPANLTAGTYSGNLVITMAGANNSPLSLPVTLNVTPAAVIPPTVVAIENAASGAPTSVSPGLNVTLFGSNMGPATLAGVQLSANGQLATTVAGTEVTFDGIPAPLIYTKSTQVSVMTPYELAGRVTTALVVTYNGVASTPLQLRVVDSAPGIYTISQTGSGQGAILNQNGSVNGPSNPEVAGNILQIYATGEGQISPPGVDGAVTPGRLPVPTPVLPVSVTIGGIPVPPSDVTFAGEAPGIVSGVLQVDARVPAGAGTGAVPVLVTVGNVTSQANVTVTLR